MWCDVERRTSSRGILRHLLTLRSAEGRWERHRRLLFACCALAFLGLRVGPAARAEGLAELSVISGFTTPIAVSVSSADGSCWVADTYNDRVVHLDAFGTALSTTPDIEGPRSVSVDPTNGSCWTVDTFNNSVLHLDASGGITSSTPALAPFAVSANPSDGSCWVAAISSIVHLDATGAVLSTTPGFSNPASVSVNSADGSCWVADEGNQRVVHLDADGGLLAAIYGFTFPSSVAANPDDGSCWVGEYGSHRRVVHLDSSGGTLSITAGFTNPDSVSVNSADGSCWVADPAAGRVVRLDAGGNVCSASTNFNQPYGVSVSSVDGSCWVADTFNNRVLHLGIDMVSVTAAPASPDTVDFGGSTELSASATDTLGHGIAWFWSDGGAGGSFWPSDAVQSPTYAPPPNETDADVIITLDVTATCDGEPVPQSASDSTTLTVHPGPIHTVSVSASATPSVVDSGGSTVLAGSAACSWDHNIALWMWDDGWVGGSFSDGSAQNPVYTAPVNTTGSDLAVTLTAMAECSLGGGGTASTTLIVKPVHLVSVSASANPSLVESGERAVLSASAVDNCGHGIVAWSWSDGGAGGTFSDASAQNPTYTAPGNTTGSDLTVTLTVTATCGGSAPLSGTASVTLTVRSLRHYVSVSASTTPAVVASEGIAALTASATDSWGHGSTDFPTWSWNDGGAGGSFSDATAQNPLYFAPANTTGSDLIVTLTVTAFCLYPESASASASIALTMHPTHSVSVNVSVDSHQIPSGGSAVLTGSASDSWGHGIASWSWDDGGAGGTFDNAAAQSSTYTAPANTSGALMEVTLTATATCDDATPASGSGAAVLVVQLAHALSVYTCACPDMPNLHELELISGEVAHLRAGVSDTNYHGWSWMWSKGDAPGTLLNPSTPWPTYVPPVNLGPGDLRVPVTVTVTCDGPDPLTASDTIVVVIPPEVVVTEICTERTTLGFGQSTEVSARAHDDQGHGITWSWSDNGAGGRFRDANAQRTDYWAPEGPLQDEITVTLTATATCHGTPSATGTKTITLTVVRGRVLSVSHAEARPGEIGTAVVSIDNAQDATYLYAWIEYDPKVVTFVTARPGTLIPDDWPTPQACSCPEAGWVEVWAEAPSDVGLSAGSGPVFLLDFEPKPLAPAGSISLLNITYAGVKTGSGVSEPASPGTDGEFLVNRWPARVVTATHAEAMPGEIATIRVGLEEGEALTGECIKLTWNPDELVFVETRPGTLPPEWWFDPYLCDEGVLVLRSLDGPPAPAGPVTLCEVDLRVASAATPETSCLLHLDWGEAYREGGVPVACTQSSEGWDIRVVPIPPRVWHVSHAEAGPGQTGTVSVSVEETEDVTTFIGTISYDPALLTPGAVRGTALLEGWSITPGVCEEGVLHICAQSTSGEGLPAGPGDLLQVDFAVAAGATPGNICTLDAEWCMCLHGDTAAPCDSTNDGDFLVLDITPPSRPAVLLAIVLSGTRINLDWQDSTDNVGVAGYRVYRDGALVVTTAESRYSEHGLAASTTYAYTVKAFDAAGNESSPATRSATTRALVPPVLTHADGASASTIMLGWQVGFVLDEVSGYRVLRNGEEIGTTIATSYLDQHLLAGTTYSYQVVALDPAGNPSAPSNTLSGTTGTLTAPGGVTAAATGSYLVQVSWEKGAPLDPVAIYRVYRNGVQIADTGNLFWADLGLAAETSYSYQVAAVDAAGHTSPLSETVSAITGPLLAPVGVSAVAVNSYTVEVRWEKANALEHTTGFRVFRNGVVIATTTGLLWLDGGRAANTTYTYQVMAIDELGHSSALSASASATTGPRAMHVERILMQLVRSGLGWTATGMVTVVDELHAPVSRASVTARWSGAVSATQLKATGKNGIATFTSPKAKGSKLTFTLTATGISASGYVWDRGNSVLTASVTTP